MDNEDRSAKVTRREFVSLAGSAAVAGSMPGSSAPGAQTGQSALHNSVDSPASAPDLCFKNAVDLARLIRNREVSATEVMTEFLSQINRVNPKVNAICTSIGDEAA